MFGARYFGARYFGARYYGHYGATAPVVDGRYAGRRYFGRRYWNQAATEVDGAYAGSRYSAARYFGRRYFGANNTSFPTDLAVTAPLAGAGTGALSSVTLTYGLDYPLSPSLTGTGTSSFNASLVYEQEVWYFENYLQLTPAAGVGTFSATLSVEYGGDAPGTYQGSRYFGSGYFGPHYWGTATEEAFELSPTAVLQGSGTASHAASIGQALSFSPAPLVSNAVGVFGSITLTYGVSTTSWLLVVPDARHRLTSDPQTLTTGGAILYIPSARHGHTADSISLTAEAFLSIPDARHGHRADNVRLRSNQWAPGASGHDNWTASSADGTWTVVNSSGKPWTPR